MVEFFLDNPEVALSVITSLRWVYQYFQSQWKNVEIMKLKSKLEVQKSQSLMNDEKFRCGYESFINLMMNIFHKDKELGETEKGIIDFMKVSILFAWPETIKTFWAYRKNVWNKSDTQNVLIYMERLLSSMRKDLGVSNDGLDEYDLLQTLVIWDIKKILDDSSSK